ncbi:hypothetical protein AB0B50_34865 [Streptomyces sp. NPDC041068]|uniref:hypothetical protein n=1 Tax=Streptomyces sp. NPDC041068 TaxID=3155130 RepID=UPI003409CB09
MGTGLRGLALAVVCVAAGLSACAGSDDGEAAVGLTAEQMRDAMPDREDLPRGWRGEAGPEVLKGKEAVKQCASMAAKCSRTEVVAVGSDTYDEGTVNRAEGDREHKAHVVVLSFESEDGAKSVMRNLVGVGRSEGSQPVKIDAGAQDTEAWSTHESGFHAAQVTMRVGKVVVGVAGEDLKEPGDVQPVAELLVDRVKDAS